MTKVRVGPVGVAAVGNRRERRAVVRHWWELDGRRGGWWLLAGLVPFGFGRPGGSGGVAQLTSRSGDHSAT